MHQRKQRADSNFLPMSPTQLSSLTSKVHPSLPRLTGPAGEGLHGTKDCVPGPSNSLHSSSHEETHFNQEVSGSCQPRPVWLRGLERRRPVNRKPQVGFPVRARAGVLGATNVSLPLSLSPLSLKSISMSFSKGKKKCLKINLHPANAVIYV